MFEAGTPNTLMRRGLTKNSLAIGTEIVADGYQSKDGICEPACRANGRDLITRRNHAVPGQRRRPRPIARNTARIALLRHCRGGPLPPRIPLGSASFCTYNLDRQPSGVLSTRPTFERIRA